MKRHICFGLLAAALLLVSCTDPIDSVLGIDIRVSNMTLTASTERPMTKTTVVSETLVYWEPGDAIAVFSNDTSAKFVADLTAPAATATFRGRLAGWKGNGTLWGVYPYSKEASFDGESITTVLPAVQTARAASFGKDINLAIARTDSDVLQFYNVGGGVCFSVTEEGIRKVLFEGLNGETLAGKVKVSFDENGLPVVREVSEGSTFITLAAPEGQTFQKDTWYYLVAIPGALEKGYKMRFYKTDDYAKRITEKSVTIKRSIYGDIQNADEGLEYEPTSLPYPKTVKEWEESDEMTMTISTSVDPILAGYTPGNAQSVEHLVQAVSGLENVASVSASADGSQLLIKQNNGVHVNLILGIQDEPEATSSAAPAPSETPTTKAATETETEAAKPKAKSSAKGNVKATSKDKQVLLLSPFQNDYPKIGPVIDTDYLSSTLNGIGYELVVPSQVTLAHFTGDYLSQYPLVLIASHGAARFTIMDGSVVTSVVNTGIEVGTLDDDADRSALAMAICDGKAQYFITVPWLQATTSESNAFSGSMVYFGSCQSYKDDDFGNFFSSQHAGFLGHQKIMAVQFDNLVMHSLVTSLAMGMNFTHAVESISRDPWAKAEQTKLTSIIHWLFDYTSSDPFPSSFSWKVDPSKLRKVDSNLRLIDAKPINLKHPLSGNRAKLTWDLPHENGEFTFKVHLNGMVYDVGTSKEYTTDSLLPGNYTWFVEASLIYQGEVVETFRSKEDKFALGGGGHASEAVDLGLSVKWASANIGATSSSDPGYYFAWGETIPNKSDYSWETYGFGPSNGLTRYNGNDGLRILLPENDVVHQVYGGNWRMPTVEEWDELRRDCTWEEVKDDDILLGYKVTSKTNDNYIFLPVSGYREGSEIKNPYSVRYWYGSLSDATWVWDRARDLNESTFDRYYHGDARCLGMPVRGVLDESANDISSSSIVDLGLSVKWAGYNVGANAAEELGNYYSWGIPSPSDRYDWENYPLRTADGELTRYNSLDVLTCLKREDDAAYQSFGGPYFRMPTMSEIEELVNNCDWIPATLNGHRGYKIKSKTNDNSIFLPIYGYMDGTQLRDGMRPRYWSSSTCDANWVWDRVRNLNESTFDRYYHGDARCLGMPVRAVYDDSADQMQLGNDSFVDLGLSVDWASCNMGTTLPEEIGNYYAWGETSTKTGFTWDNYRFGSPDGFSKYNSLDGLRIMSKDDDVVYKRFSGEYRIPTKAEWEELWNNCDAELRRINNRWGYLLTSQKNGNSIFLPLSGYLDGTQLRDGMRSRYWSSSLSDADWIWDRARNLNESTFDRYYHGDARCLGMPVRAIRAKYESPVTEGEFVDLGLKVKWASRNIGASIPEETGNYYAWGEIATKDSFTLDNYRHCSDASTGAFSKYNSDDTRTFLDWNDDVVQITKGENWRMPTMDDWVELQENCDWELTTMNGTRGYRIVSRINENSIFLPIAGFKEGSQLRDEMRARYWSSSTSDANWIWDRVRNLNESTFERYYHGDARYLGMPVRGVYDDSANQMQLGTSDFVDLGLSVDWARCNMGSTLPQQIGNYYAWGEMTTKSSYSWDNYRFGKSDELTKYNANDGVRVLYKDDDVVYKKYSGKYRIPTKAEWEELWNNCDSELRRINNHWGYLLTSKKNGNSIFLPLTGYMDGGQIRGCMKPRYWSSSLSDADWVYDRARDLNESTFDRYYHGDARCLGMPVRAIRAKYEKKVTEGDLIDMGLNVKWASCNIGAESPEDFGDYYAWGETTTKSSYSWENYLHCNEGSSGSLNKYNSDDGRRYLDWSDDVVHAKKGGSWRMPTMDDWAELQSNCEWELTTMNGTRGYRIVSNINQNSIFLPIAGFMDGIQLRDGMKSRYWSSILSDATWVYDRARDLNESTFDRYYHGDARCVGMPVRGVYDDSATNLSEGETIDMGLSVDWASCNIGSNTPEGFGSYFGWGETITHNNYSWANYVHSADGTAGNLSKYNAEDKYRVLDDQDDAAKRYSSGSLRMPTIEEWSELQNNATWVLKIRNGHLGYLITSNINGNKLFLPIAGYKDGQQFRDGQRPRYWASTLSDAGWVWDRARNLNESTFDRYYHGDARFLGMPVRGVITGHGGPGVAVTGVSLDKTQLELNLRGTAQLIATVTPSDATNPSVTWSSNRESVATVSADGLVTAVSEGTATITVMTVAGGFTAKCTVTVSDSDIHVTGVTLDKSEMSLSVGCGGLLIPMVTPVDAANDTVTWQSSNPNAVRISAGGRVFAISPGVSTITATTVDGNFSVTCQVSVDSKKPFESKDLGLSVQWATFNVGACCPSDYGEYFAWAETEPKDAYRWNNYKWGDAFSGSLTKYATSYTDKLDNEDDVARVYWGNGWRMPTMSEQQELIDECDWVWTREGLVYGYRVTSRKPGYTDQSIFLPASGYMEGDELQEPMSAGRYWASTLFFGQPAQAYLTSFSSSGKLSTMQNRCVGMTVRPVCKAAPVTGITLDKPELTLQEGETEQLTATVMPFNAGNRTVTWKSNSESVATVSSDGLVTAISAGNATITAITAEGGFTATCSVKVNPYESSDYSVDGIVHTIQKATSGNGINIVLMGDAFSDRLIADGTYERMMKKAADSFFSEEPYHSFRHLFNVYYVDVVSKNEIYNGETALGTSYGQGTEVNGNHDLVASYALNVLTPSQMNKSVIVVLMNRDYYAGTCYYWDDGADEGDYGIGTAIAYFPTNSDDNIFTVLISHEAGGHGFGKLADEYVNYGFEKTTVPQDKINYTKEVAPYGWRKNVDFTSDVNSVKWHQFIADERYNSEEISTYEGGLTYGKGVWHPTKHSIMNDNTGGFNAPSRYAIWYRIHKQAYGEDWQGTYEDFVQYDKVNQTPAAFARRKQQIEQAAKHPLPHLAPPVLITKD